MDGQYAGNARSNFLPNSSYHNEEEDGLLACPLGCSARKPAQRYKDWKGLVIPFSLSSLPS